MQQLKLIAFDAEDLGVISAHLQDAALTVGDMAYLPREKRFAAILSRFDWLQAAGSGQMGGPCDRARTALRFERVLGAKLQGLDRARPEVSLALLAILFEGVGPDNPGGSVTLHFAGGAAIRLEVECIEAELRDLGPAPQARRPFASETGSGTSH